MQSFLGSTGQARKLDVALVSLTMAAVAGIAQFLGPKEWTMPGFAGVLAFGTLGLVLLLRVRCPRCHRSLGFWAMRNHSMGKWQTALQTVGECPYCRYTPGPVAKAP